MTTSNDGYSGQQMLTDASSDYNRMVFLVKQILGTKATATIVKVVSVSEGNDGSVNPVGTVSVLPLVNMIDGVGNVTKHGTLQNLPYMRMQGGKQAVIIDPIAGDIGLVVFASRDISSVKKNKAQANPGSRRQMDMADGMYVGGLLGEKPESYVRFYEGNKIEVSPDNGTSIVTLEPDLITMKATVVKIDGALQVTGEVSGVGANPIHFAAPITSNSDITTTAEVYAKSTNAQSIPLSQHRHGGVTSGGTGNTQGPKV